MKSLSSLESAASKAVDSLSPEERADYHFKLFRELSQSLLSSDEIDKNLDKSRLDIIKGLDLKDRLEVVFLVLIKFAYLNEGLYLNERISSFTILHTLVEAHLLYSRMLLERVPDLTPAEVASLNNTIKRYSPKLQSVQQKINEIISLDDWRLIEENTGYTCRAEALS